MELSQLDALCADLSVAAKALRALCDSSGSSPASGNEPGKETLFPTIISQDSKNEVMLARNNLCGIATRLQTLLAGPTCFIRRMATQNQLLACLKWLGEYQIIAYIPLSDSISLEELADLADVPEHTLSRVIRMTATAGFLHEPQLGQVAHTTLSSSFTTELQYFDAAMFLANKVAPSALDLALDTQKLTRNASNMTVLRNSQYFDPQRVPETQLNRQWLAYRHSVGSMENDLVALLNLLNWQSLGEASVIHICDRYTKSSHTLVHMSHALRVTIQTYDYTPAETTLNGSGEMEEDAALSHRITVHRRNPTAIQPVQDAAVYIVQPSFCAKSTENYEPQELLSIELKSHFNILQANPSALLILAPIMLPEPGSVAVNLEVQARLIDFAEMQFNQRGAVEVTELFKLTESICDVHGRLMVTNRLRSADGATIALAVKYQSFAGNNDLT